jgi:hypothetical protein
MSKVRRETIRRHKHTSTNRGRKSIGRRVTKVEKEEEEEEVITVEI